MKHFLHLVRCVFLISLWGGAQDFAFAAENNWVFFGTYTGKNSKGIYASKFDPDTGRLGPAQLAAELTNPSFLAIHPNKKFIYAVMETSDFGGGRTGGVSAFSLDPETGRLELLNHQPSGGAGPCHVSVDQTGQAVLVANYNSGSIASFPAGADGRLGQAGSVIQHEGSGANPRRQQGPHAHCITMDPASRFAYVADLGLDKILVYALTPSEAKLTPNDPPFVKLDPGVGPRHLAFDRSGRHLYVINEISCTVAAFHADPTHGKLTFFQSISTLPEEVKPGYSTAEIEMHPSGKFLFGSNRGHDSIVAYSIDAETGLLRVVQHQPTGGRTPRSFGIDPQGRFLLAANQDSDTVLVFAIDPNTGKLTATGQSLEVPAPVCVKFL